MKLPIIRVLLLLFVTGLYLSVMAGGVFADNNDPGPDSDAIVTGTDSFGNPIYGKNPPWIGHVRSQTGAPVVGAVVRQKTNTGLTRETSTNNDGFFYFKSQKAFNCGDNPHTFTVTNLSDCSSIIDSPGNIVSMRNLDDLGGAIICQVAPPTPTPRVPACNVACTIPGDCLGAKDGCTVCSGGFCKKPPPACNVACTIPGDCLGAKDGCTLCLPGVAGAGKTCQKQACNARCETRDDCATDAVKNGNTCSECVADASGVKTCQPAPTPTPTPILTCNTACTTSAGCQRGVDGCTACIPNDTGTGSVCKTPPACGTSCTKNSQCAGARNGCNICNEGKCSAFSPDMCKCDGMDFQSANGQTFFPGDKVTFTAYGKVEGEDTKIADLQSMTFSLYQSSLTDPNKAVRIAQSTAITPQIVQNTPTKVRYKVTWDQNIPATVPSGSLFRVQAVIKCVAKTGVLGTQTITNDKRNFFADIVAMVNALYAGIGKAKTATLGESVKQLQLKPFFPGAKILEKSCTQVRFVFE